MLAPLPIEFNQTLLFHFLPGHHQERSRKGTPVREGEVELGGGGSGAGGAFLHVQVREGKLLSLDRHPDLDPFTIGNTSFVAREMNTQELQTVAIIANPFSRTRSAMMMAMISLSAG